MQILQAADKWGVPPWQVEDEASRLWWERWRAWEDELERFRKEKAGDKQG